MEEQPRKQFSRIPPFNPAKRALAIQNAIAKKKINHNEIIDDILMLLEQMVFLEEKAA